MIAYVDEQGRILDTPPDPADKEEIKAEDIEIGVPNKEDDANYDPVRKGVVSFFNESKGYGFIKDNETGEEHFVHVSGLIDKINQDDEVTFELQQGKKGLNAVNVKLV